MPLRYECRGGMGPNTGTFESRENAGPPPLAAVAFRPYSNPILKEERNDERTAKYRRRQAGLCRFRPR